MNKHEPLIQLDGNAFHGQTSLPHPGLSVLRSLFSSIQQWLCYSCDGAPSTIAVLVKIGMSFGVKEQILGARFWEASATHFALGERGAHTGCFPCTNVLV